MRPGRTIRRPIKKRAKGKRAEHLNKKTRKGQKGKKLNTHHKPLPSEEPKARPRSTSTSLLFHRKEKMALGLWSRKQRGSGAGRRHQRRWILPFPKSSEGKEEEESRPRIKTNNKNGGSKGETTPGMSRNSAIYISKRKSNTEDTQGCRQRGRGRRHCKKRRA